MARKKWSDLWVSLSVPAFRSWVIANMFSTTANRALAVVVGFQVYSLTHKAIFLGMLGLVEAVPAISLALYGGYVSDRMDRRRILLATTSVSILCAGLFAFVSTHLDPLRLI